MSTNHIKVYVQVTSTIEERMRLNLHELVINCFRISYLGKFIKIS